mmetsp:Transcript_15954/g.26735  ORF Transcript_15954/g.26735 Transcript_15954/m.26735 type:complete len:287 (+) Transcript_15954:127-987(+)
MVLKNIGVVLLSTLHCYFATSAHHHYNYSDVINQRLRWEQNCLDPVAPGARDPRGKLKPNCTLYYLHNHKTGGTTLCVTATKSGFNVTSRYENCNIPRSVLKLNANSMDIERYAVNNSLQFIAQEHKPFRVHEFSTNFVFMTTIRHPMDRLVSHLHHEFCQYNEDFARKTLRSFGCLAPYGTFSSLLHDPCMKSQRISEITTDFYLAMLTGCTNRVFSIGGENSITEKNVCSESHLHQAKRVLHLFSVIMISDNSMEMDRYCMVHHTSNHYFYLFVVLNLSHHIVL